MSEYNRLYSSDFLRDIRKVKKKIDMRKRLYNKINEIVKNPFHYKLLRNVMKGKCRIHIASYVLTFDVNEKEKTVTFHRFLHHDKVYRQS